MHIAYNNPFRFTDPSGNAPKDFNKSDSWHFWNELTNSDSYLANAAGYTGLFFYEVGDMLTFGGVSRQDRTMTEYQRGEITGNEALWRTAGNVAVSAPLLVAGIITGGSSIAVQAGVGALAAGIQRFGVDNYEMSYEGRKEFSSAGEYATNIALGGIFGGVGGFIGKFPGIATPLFNAEAKQGIGIVQKTLLGIKSLPKAFNIFMKNESKLMKDEIQAVGNWFRNAERSITGKPTPAPIYETKTNIKTGKQVTAKPDANEIQAGKMYQAEGYDVIHKVEASKLGISGEQTPDLFVRGKGEIDVYTPKKLTSDRISSMIEQKGKQTSIAHVQASIDSNLMNETVKRVFNKPSARSLNIREIIFEKNGILINFKRPYYFVPRFIPNSNQEDK